MVTALVLVEEARLEALGATLGALVVGVASGLVADAVVLVRRSDPEIASVVDASGAAMAEVDRHADPWATGAALARRDWLFCLEAGDLPGEGWIRAIDRFLAAGRDPGMGRLRRPEPLRSRAAIWIESRVGARRPRPGDLVHRRLAATAPFPSRIRPSPIAAAIDRDPVRR